MEYRCKAARMVATACDIRNEASGSRLPRGVGADVWTGSRIHEYMLWEQFSRKNRISTEYKLIQCLQFGALLLQRRTHRHGVRDQVSRPVFLGRCSFLARARR
jgi:hypothetical protein